MKNEQNEKNALDALNAVNIAEKAKSENGENGVYLPTFANKQKRKQTREKIQIIFLAIARTVKEKKVSNEAQFKKECAVMLKNLQSLQKERFLPATKLHEMYSPSILLKSADEKRVYDAVNILLQQYMK